MAAAAARGIVVGHTPGVLTETTADLAFALLLASARRLPEAERYLRAGRWRTWSPDLLVGRDVHGATLGDRRARWLRPTCCPYRTSFRCTCR